MAMLVRAFPCHVQLAWQPTNLFELHNIHMVQTRLELNLPPDFFRA